jgi:hypothetical protein
VSVATRPPRWLNLQPIRSDIDRAFDTATFRCARCEKAGGRVYAIGPPRAITREAADHVLAGHADDQAAVEWAREVLPGVLS